MCFSGLINVLTGDAFIATILIIVGSIAIGIFTIIFYIKYLKKIKKQKENRKKIKMIESPILDQSCSPINSPIFALDSLKKIPYDVSKKVNEFENFSLGSSPLQLHGENHNNKDFKIQIKELEKPQVDSDTGNEHENIIGEPVQVQEEEKE